MMNDLIAEMDKTLNSMEKHRIILEHISCPANQGILEKLFRSRTDVLKRIANMTKTAEERLRITNNDYLNSEDITLRKAISALEEFNTTRIVPRASKSLLHSLISQEQEVKSAYQTAKLLYGRLASDDKFIYKRWVFFILRLNVMSTKYAQREACINILTLVKRGVIDDRTGYFYAGMLPGSRVTVRDIFHHVKPIHVQAARDTIVYTEISFAEYEQALTAFRFAPLAAQNNPAAVQLLQTLFGFMFQQMMSATAAFRSKCSERISLDDLLQKHHLGAAASKTP